MGVRGGALAGWRGHVGVYPPYLLPRSRTGTWLRDSSWASACFWGCVGPVQRELRPQQQLQAKLFNFPDRLVPLRKRRSSAEAGGSWGAS